MVGNLGREREEGWEGSVRGDIKNNRRRKKKKLGQESHWWCGFPHNEEKFLFLGQLWESW